MNSHGNVTGNSLPHGNRSQRPQPPASVGARYARWGSFDWLLVGLFILVLIAVSPVGHVVAIMALISFIGIPIYFLLAALPAAFLILLFVRLCMHTWKHWRAGQFLPAALLGVAALIMVQFFVVGAWLENARLDRQAQALMAQDAPLATAPAAIETLGLVRFTAFARDNAQDCDDACQRLLLNGQVKRVFMGGLAPRESTISDEQPGTLYWLEQRLSCPAVKIADNLRSSDFSPLPDTQNRKPGERAPSAAEVLRLKIASGTCLVSAPATLAQADAVLAYGNIAYGKSNYAAGDLSSADTINASRVEFHQRMNGALQRVHRSTSLRYLRFPGVRVPTYIHGAELRVKTGWMRSARQLGEPTRYGQTPPVAAFAINRLGLKLQLDAGKDIAEDRGAALDRILASRGEMSALDAKIIVDYLETLSRSAWRKDARIEAADARRVLAIVADTRVALPHVITGAVRLAGSQVPERAEPLARALFARIAAQADAAPAGNAFALWKNEIRNAANALAVLPDDILRGHRADMLALMTRNGKREAAVALIKRLDIFGPAVIPDLIAMIDDARIEGDEINSGSSRTRRRSEWADVYRAGLTSLCGIAPQATSALPQVREQTERADERLKKRFAQNWAAVLARMGMAEDEVRALLVANPDDEKAARDFGFAWRRATGRNACGN